MVSPTRGKNGGADGEPIPATPYTPSPWVARDYKNSEGNIWIDCEAWARTKGGILVRSTKQSARTVGGTVAVALGTGVGDGGWTVGANAAVLAAAPELVEALAPLVGWLERHMAGGGEGPPDDLLDGANAALRKAGLPG